MIKRLHALIGLLILGACQTIPLKQSTTQPISDFPPSNAMISPIFQPTPTPSISPFNLTQKDESSHVKGYVFDEHHQPISGARIEALSLNSDWAGEIMVKTDEQGRYEFYVIAGVQVVYTAKANGRSTRRRFEIISPNKGIDYSNIRYDFGNNGQETSYSPAYQALDSRPEITQVSPGRNEPRISPNTDIVLSFSEPVNRQNVENAFAIYSYNTRQLTVDANNPRQGERGMCYQTYGKPTSSVDTCHLSNTLFGESNITHISGTPIYDMHAFDIHWNGENTEARFVFKPGFALPTDKDPNLVPDYQVALKNFDGKSTLQDLEGKSRNDNHFKLTDGDFEASYKFSIQTDLKAPQLVSAQMIDDKIYLRFDEPMVFPLHNKVIAGGLSQSEKSHQQTAASYPGSTELPSGKIAAQNYTMTFFDAQNQAHNKTTWDTFKGQAHFDINDNHTVILSNDAPGQWRALLDKTQRILVEVAPTVVDPAGNPMDIEQRSASLTL